MSENKEKINQRNIDIIVPNDTREITIRLIDWLRVYRKIKNVPKKNPLYLTITGACWGIGGSAIFTVIALYQTTSNINSWVTPAFCIIGTAAIILGFITAHFVKENNKTIESNCLEIQKDMSEIYSIFFPNQDLDSAN